MFIMNKLEKVIWIRAWLQRFGNRDNETFNIEVLINNEIWHLSLQYMYGFDGNIYKPYDWCRNGFKHVNYNEISDRSNEELDLIIQQLTEKSKEII